LRTVGSGLIYAGLVVLWSIYFIPRWLRRHEELSESRSIERFDRAMRILSRRESTPDRRYVVVPPRPEAARTSASGPRRSARRGFATTSPATVRRRRMVAGILLTFLITLLLAPFTALRWWAPVLVVVALAGYLVHCRLQARTRSEVSRTRAAVRRRSRSRLLRFDSIERLMAVRRELAAERAAEDARWESAEAALRQEREAEEQRLRAEADGWTPVPVPLPTYVTKPVAPRSAGTVDLTRPGAWTEAQRATEVPEQRPASAAAMAALLDDAEAADDQLDTILHRRAVND
jgi:hypothetical protein